MNRINWAKWLSIIFFLIPMLVILLFPVHLSILAPGELVAANPATIRAPLDGVIGQFEVQPNQIGVMNVVHVHCGHVSCA